MQEGRLQKLPILSQLCRCAFKWQCPAFCPVIVLRLFLLYLNSGGSFKKDLGFFLFMNEHSVLLMFPIRPATDRLTGGTQSTFLLVLSLELLIHTYYTLTTAQLHTIKWESQT